MAAYTVPYLKSLPAPSVRKLLRDAGYTMRQVGLVKRDRDGQRAAHTVVSRVIRKQMASAPVWEAIAYCLNHPKRERVPA